MQRFGDNWTDNKLQRVKKYLAAYTTALKNTPFTTFYVDAFAGTGYRHSGAKIEYSLLKDLESEPLKNGSAANSLEIVPAFDRYIFVENDPAKFAELEKLKNKYLNLSDRITLYKGDTTDVIKNLCNQDWIQKNQRGVIFLDPFGMNVRWNIIEMIAKTKALDLWLLFPVGIAVNRMITKDGQIASAWRQILNDVFGTDAWYESFYKTDDSNQLKLFQINTMPLIEKTVDFKGIATYFNNRL